MVERTKNKHNGIILCHLTKKTRREIELDGSSSSYSNAPWGISALHEENKYQNLDLLENSSNS
jgi:hypothetical protein